MAEMTVQVTEKMAKFLEWAKAKGEDEIRNIVRGRLSMLKEECERKNGMHDSDGFRWDPTLEPNDEPDQWRSGGDCNLCRRREYCLKKCRANKMLKAIMTPFLYEQYMLETPEELVKETASGLTPEALLKMMGVDGGKLS